jgi:FMN reductase [NAD(P)H]
MNETVRLLQAHHSSRSNKTGSTPEEILEDSIESAHRAPTTNNSQQVSLVVVCNADGAGSALSSVGPVI